LAGLQAAQTQRTGATPQSVTTQALDYVQENPKEALGYGALAYGALQAPKIASKVADYRLKQRELGLKERSLAAYEAQVAKQGAVPELLNPQDDLINNVRQNEFDQLKAAQPAQPTARELRDQIALQRDQLKLEQDKIKHENFVRQNTWSPEEIALGRKIKDPAELQLAKKIMAQEAAKSGIAPTPAGSAPIAELPNGAELPKSQFDLSQLGKSQDPLAGKGWQPPPQSFGPIQPANVVSTGSTPESAADSIEKTEKLKEAVAPKQAPVSKVKKPISPEDAALTKQELGMKKHLLEMYGAKDYPLAAEQAYGKVKDILGYTPAYPVGEGGSLNPEEKGKVLGYRKENIAGPKVNLTKEMKTILKKGGPAVGVLAATVEFANAKTPEQKANAGANLIGAVLPPGADIFEAGAPIVDQQTISNAYKLGSPYAQTEEAKLARLRERAGAGRGIAPPSAYMR
jgi:hypothetical protein